MNRRASLTFRRLLVPKFSDLISSFAEMSTCARIKFFDAKRGQGKPKFEDRMHPNHYQHSSKLLLSQLVFFFFKEGFPGFVFLFHTAKTNKCMDGSMHVTACTPSTRPQGMDS